MKPIYNYFRPCSGIVDPNLRGMSGPYARTHWIRIAFTMQFVLSDISPQVEEEVCARRWHHFFKGVGQSRSAPASGCSFWQGGQK